MSELVHPTHAQLKLLDKWRVSTFWVMLVGYIGYYLCRGNLPAAVPLISAEFGYTNTQLGIIFTFSELCYAFGKFVNGPLADKFGGRRVFLIGMVGAIAFNLLFSQVSSILMFTVVWCLCRYFLSMGWGGIIKTVGAWHKPERSGTVMGFISINFQLGGGIAVLYCSLLLAMGMGWQGMFIVPALTLALIMVWSFFASKESPQSVVPNVKYGQNAGEKQAVTDFAGQEKPRVREIIPTLLKVDIFRWMLVFSFLTTFLRSIFMFWTAKFLVDIGMGNSGAILKSAIFPFLGIIGTVALGWYTDNYARNGDRAKAMWIFLSGLVVSLLGIALLVPFRTEYQNTIVFLTGACGFFLIGPYSMTSGCLTLDMAGAKAGGSATGMLDGMGYIGGALAAWGAGVLSDILGWEHVFYGLSGVSFVSVLVCYRMSLLFQKRGTDSPDSDNASESLQPKMV